MTCGCGSQREECGVVWLGPAFHPDPDPTASHPNKGREGKGRRACMMHDVCGLRGSGGFAPGREKFKGVMIRT